MFELALVYVALRVAERLALRILDSTVIEPVADAVTARLLKAVAVMRTAVEARRRRRARRGERGGRQR